MDSIPKTYQLVNQKAPLNRAYHVWKRYKNKTYKCVICGGISRIPTIGELPDRFEKLSNEDRALCPATN